MAQDRVKDSCEKKQSTGENYKCRGKKEKGYQTKVVIRRLPPTMNDEQFLDQISPVPEHDYYHFVKGDLRLGQYAFSRAYLNFTLQEDIFMFKEKFDGYVFLDGKGNEFPAIVEFAPFQKIPKRRSKKRDTKCGTIETDVDYLNFLESMKNPDEQSLPTAEVYLEEIETREKELRANNGVLRKTTPLIEYLKQRKMEQQKIREEKREERKRKESEKKRLREEERRRRKAEKERKEKLLQKESQSDKSSICEDVEDSVPSEDGKPDTVVQVLKNPEREKEMKEQVAPQKTKDYYSRHTREEKYAKDWDTDRDRTKARDRGKSEKQIMSRDRGRRDRNEYKSYYASSKSTNKESRQKSSKYQAPVSVVVKSEDKNIKKEDCSTKESNDKCVAKIKRDNSCPGNVETLGNNCEGGDDDFCGPSMKEIDRRLEANDESKSEGSLNESKDQSKDPRTERRIRNKDRPSLEIYRPGMRRITGVQRNSSQKEISTSTSNSSSPSPTPPLTVNSSKPQMEVENS